MKISSDKKSSIRILGLMTGSSADGLDLCLVEFSGNGESPEYKILFSTEIPYPLTFQSAFLNPLELNDKQIEIFDEDLGQWFADEISKLELEFDIIASHGQTIKHEPPQFTLQIGDPKYMARRFNVPVIYDFRSADIEQGGQGAPLIPIVDRLLFQQADENVLALNIGGIANLTVIPALNNKHPLLAWDTGPGNTLIDKAVRIYSNHKLNYDPQGSIAAQGKLNRKLLDHLLKHKFYQLPPPRSAGQEQFGNKYFMSLLKQFYPNSQQEFKDLILTLTVLTGRTIATSVSTIAKKYSPKSMFVGGGGYKNISLMNILKQDLPGINIEGVKLKGVTEDNKEAFGFAYLAYLKIRSLPGNIPSVTGARHEVILGKSYSPDL